MAQGLLKGESGRRTVAQTRPSFPKMPPAPSAFPYKRAPQAPGDKLSPFEEGYSLGRRPPEADAACVFRAPPTVSWYYYIPFQTNAHTWSTRSGSSIWEGLRESRWFKWSLIHFSFLFQPLWHTSDKTFCQGMWQQSEGRIAFMPFSRMSYKVNISKFSWNLNQDCLFNFRWF